MTTPVADRAVLDTNILLAATDESREDHEDATAAMNVWPASGMVLYTSGQIPREYLAGRTIDLRRSSRACWRLAARRRQ